MKTVLLFLLLTSTLNVYSQADQQLIQEANQYEAGLNENAALEALKKALQINPKSYYALWKASELSSRIGNRQTNKAKKQEYYKAGKTYAEAAIKVYPAGADGYYVLAVAMGRHALMHSGKEKINAVKDIAANAEKAIKLNPNHARAWHVLGKWHYEVSDLNMMEKAGVKLMYGGLPDASLNDCIKAYEKSRSLDPNFALNYLELAKAYKRNDQEAKAIEILRKLAGLPIRTQDDTSIKAEGASLLKKLLD